MAPFKHDRIDEFKEKDEGTRISTDSMRLAISNVFCAFIYFISVFHSS